CCRRRRRRLRRGGRRHVRGGPGGDGRRWRLRCRRRRPRLLGDADGPWSGIALAGEAGGGEVLEQVERVADEGQLGLAPLAVHERDRHFPHPGPDPQRFQYQGRHERVVVIGDRLLAEPPVEVGREGVIAGSPLPYFWVTGHEGGVAVCDGALEAAGDGPVYGAATLDITRAN